jgi:hypothetical protein
MAKSVPSTWFFSVWIRTQVGLSGKPSWGPAGEHRRPPLSAWSREARLRSEAPLCEPAIRDP